MNFTEHHPIVESFLKRGCLNNIHETLRKGFIWQPATACHVHNWSRILRGANQKCKRIQCHHSAEDQVRHHSVPQDSTVVYFAQCKANLMHGRRPLRGQTILLSILFLYVLNWYRESCHSSGSIFGVCDIEGGIRAETGLRWKERNVFQIPL
jgi:hypothetical protein